MKLICLTGIDGAGKTTLARQAVAALRRQGCPAAYLYGRTRPVLSRGLMALGRTLWLRGHDPWRDYPDYAAVKNRTMRNRVLAVLYAAAMLFDYYVQMWLKLLPYVGSDRLIISDRYLYDTVISDLAVHLSYTDEQAADFIDAGFRLLPCPALTLLVDLPESIAFSRKRDVPHRAYLRERRRWYQTLLARPEVERVDGAPALAVVADDVVARISRRALVREAP